MGFGMRPDISALSPEKMKKPPFRRLSSGATLKEGAYFGASTIII
jgi:hypothetical protein